MYIHMNVCMYILYIYEYICLCEYIYVNLHYVCVCIQNPHTSCLGQWANLKP